MAQLARLRWFAVNVGLLFASGWASLLALVLLYVVLGQTRPSELLGQWFVASSFWCLMSVVPGFAFLVILRRVGKSAGRVTVVLLAILVVGVGATLLWWKLMLGQAAGPGEAIGVFELGALGWTMFGLVVRRT